MSIEGQGHFFTIYFPGFVCLCFTRPRNQVSVYRTIGPLVHTWDHLYLSIRYYLEMTSGYRVQCPRVGKGSKSRKSVFMSNSDTQCLLKKIALLVDILTGSLFLHLMTIWVNKVHL